MPRPSRTCSTAARETPRGSWTAIPNYTNGSLTNTAAGQTNYTNRRLRLHPGPAYYGKTFFIWPPDPRQHLSNPTVQRQRRHDVQAVLHRLRLLEHRFLEPTIWQPLYGIDSSLFHHHRDHNWPWPNDGGSSLSTYLTSKVYVPGSTTTKLTTSNAIYQKIMRLYNWDYVVDNVGTTPCDWRLRFFGTNDNTVLFNTSTGTLNRRESAPTRSTIARSSAGSHHLPTHSRLSFERVGSPIIRRFPPPSPEPGRATVDRPAVLGRVHRLRAGIPQTAAGVYTDVSAMAGYGSDFTLGHHGHQHPSCLRTQYMGYTDNPDRPLLRFWFGPMMMVDYLQNYNMDTNVSNYFYMQPGDAYEAPSYTAKQSFIAAVSTMQTNHPNDWATFVAYNSPRTSSLASAGRFNCVRSPLGTNYNYTSAALVFPFGTINADGSSDGTEVNRYTADPKTGLTPSADSVSTPPRRWSPGRSRHHATPRSPSAPRTETLSGRSETSRGIEEASDSGGQRCQSCRQTGSTSTTRCRARASRWSSSRTWRPSRPVTCSRWPSTPSTSPATAWTRARWPVQQAGGAYTTELLADDVAAFMQAVGGRYIFGFSLGALTGTWLAANLELVRSLSLHSRHAGTRRSHGESRHERPEHFSVVFVVLQLKRKWCGAQSRTAPRSTSSWRPLSPRNSQP